MLRPISFLTLALHLTVTMFIVVGAGPIRFSAAQEFRIDTELFIGDSKEAAVETLTIFSHGLIYDFPIGESSEITMLDTFRGRLTLLDPARRLKCPLSTQELNDWTLALATSAAQSKDALFMFAAQPKFDVKEEEYQEHGQSWVRLNLTAKELSYQVVAYRPQHPEAVPQFRYFADQFARINALLPGHLPSGARQELNAALAERKLMPLEITRTIPSANPLGRKLVVRSRHLVNWSLSGEDRKKIDRAGTFNAEFKAVGFEEFRTPTGAKATKTASK